MIPIPINKAQEFFIILIMVRSKYSFLRELQLDIGKDYVFFRAKKECTAIVEIIIVPPIRVSILGCS